MPVSLPVGSSNLNGAQLSTIADQTTTKNSQEDMKLDRSRRASKMALQVAAANTRIEKNKESADHKLSADQTKADGSGIGGIIGMILAIVAIVAGIICCCTGVGALVG